MKIFLMFFAVLAFANPPKDEKCIIGDTKSCVETEKEKKKQDFLKKLCDQGDKEACQKLKKGIKKY